MNTKYIKITNVLDGIPPGIFTHDLGFASREYDDLSMSVLKSLAGEIRKLVPKISDDYERRLMHMHLKGITDSIKIAEKNHIYACWNIALLRKAAQDLRTLIMSKENIYKRESAI